MRKKAKMLTVPDVAQRLGMSERTVRKWLATGYLKDAEFISWPGRGYWMIPEASLRGVEARPVGRPKKMDGAKGAEVASKRIK